MVDETSIPTPEDRVAPLIQYDIERKKQLYFIGHIGEVITPSEWVEFCKFVTIDAINTSSSNGLDLVNKNNELEIENARLQLELINTDSKFRVSIREETIQDIITTVSSLITDPGVNEMHTSGITVVLDILKRELK